jgi:hypothetical protein
VTTSIESKGAIISFSKLSQGIPKELLQPFIFYFTHFEVSCPEKPIGSETTRRQKLIAHRKLACPRRVIQI